MADDSNWASQISIDPYLVSEAEKWASFGRPDKNKFVIAMGEFLGLDVQRTERTFNPLRSPTDPARFGRSTTNDVYNMLAKIYDQLPESLTYGQVEDGAVVNSVIPLLDLKPWLYAGLKSEAFSGSESDRAEEAIAVIDARNDVSISQMFGASGVNVTDPRVVAAQQARRSDSTSTARVDIQGFTATPSPSPTEVSTGTAPVATSPTSAEPGSPAAAGQDMTTTIDLINAGSAEGFVSATDYLQTYAKAGLAEIEQRFGGTTFDISKLAFTGTNVENPAQVSFREALRYPYDLDRKSLERLQGLLLQGGLYDAVGTKYSTLGYMDNQTKMAWDTALVESVRQGQDLSTYLNGRAKTFAAERAAQNKIVFGDPDAIYQSARTLAINLIGRGLTDSEFQSFIGMFRQWEKQALVEPSFSVENYQTDLKAKAQEYFDDTFATERAITDAADWWKGRPGQ